MALVSGIITGVTTGATAINKIGSLFGGGSNFAQQGRERKREQLSRKGFNWRKTSGVPRGEEWNIDNWSDQGLDNIARLYDRYGQIAVDLHNEKKIRNDRIASNFATLEQMALARKDAQNSGGTGGAFGSGFFSGNAGEKAIDAGTGVLVALAVAGAGFWLINKG